MQETYIKGTSRGSSLFRYKDNFSMPTLEVSTCVANGKPRVF